MAERCDVTCLARDVIKGVVSREASRISLSKQLFVVVIVFASDVYNEVSSSCLSCSSHPSPLPQLADVTHRLAVLTSLLPCQRRGFANIGRFYGIVVSVNSLSSRSSDYHNVTSFGADLRAFLVASQTQCDRARPLALFYEYSSKDCV